MKYLLVLGREAKISLAELESLFGSQQVAVLSEQLATVEAPRLSLDRLGGSIKAARILDQKPADFLATLPPGKITLGFSDYSPHATPASTWALALKHKNLLKRHGRNVRLIPNQKTAALSSATAHHNQLGEKLNHLEIIKYRNLYATSIGSQNITAYAKRDQARPARDAFVGMLPPKLAQILINLATAGQKSGLVLDPFCGTGVVLQEAALMGYAVYGSDLADKMIDYSRRNLEWLATQSYFHTKSQSPAVQLEVGDATKHHWRPIPNYIASEIYLGQPLSSPPSSIKLKELQQSTKTLLFAFLRNIGQQIPHGTTLALAIPAWKRPDGSYQGLDILDEIKNLGYNAKKYRYASFSELLYYRENQIVARQIIVLRKK
ncbi:hypothetical protein IJ102_03080 [Candidatus Saccharibacteria bacterium]|nr:hypothetical protein [Candidatus Saccharibacteria bacterium]